MPRIDATVSIGGDFLPLEQGLRQALTRAEKKFGRNYKPFDLGYVSGDIAQFTKSLNAANARVLAFAASAGSLYAIGNAMSSIVKTTIQVEKNLTAIASIASLSTSNLENFSKSLFDIARNTGQSFDTASGAALEFSRQGLSLNKTLKATQDALILTRVSGLDAANSVQVLTAAVNSFNQAGLDSSKIVNTLVSVDDKFAVSAGGLGAAIQRVGSTAQDAGVSFNELVAAVTAAQQVTQRGEQIIGNSLKTIFTRFQRGANLDLLENLGIATQDGSGGIRNTLDLLGELAARYDQLGQAQRNQIAEQLGGVYQINILKALVGDAGKQFSVYQNALDAANNATNEAVTRNALLNQTLSARSNEFVVNLQQAASLIGQLSAAPVLNRVFDLTNFAGSLGKQVDEISLGIGGDIGQGILKGLGDAITGAGLPLALAFISKNLFKFVNDAQKGLVSVLGLNNKRQDTEQKIVGLVNSGVQAYDRMKISLLAVEQQEAAILRLLERQAAARSLSVTAGLATVPAVGRGTNQRLKNIPSFANPLREAIARERASGVPANAIRIGTSGALRGPGNPRGIGVYNTIDEPRGLGQGIARSRGLGINPKISGIPNFAAPYYVPNPDNDQSFGTNTRNLIRKLLGQVASGAKSFEQAGNEFQQAIKDTKRYGKLYYNNTLGPGNSDLIRSRYFGSPLPANEPTTPYAFKAGQTFKDKNGDIVTIRSTFTDSGEPRVNVHGKGFSSKKYPEEAMDARVIQNMIQSGKLKPYTSPEERKILREQEKQLKKEQSAAEKRNKLLTQSAQKALQSQDNILKQIQYSTSGIPANPKLFGSAIATAPLASGSPNISKTALENSYNNSLIREREAAANAALTVRARKALEKQAKELAQLRTPALNVNNLTSGVFTGSPDAPLSINIPTNVAARGVVSAQNARNQQYRNRKFGSRELERLTNRFNSGTASLSEVIRLARMTNQNPKDLRAQFFANNPVLGPGVPPPPPPSIPTPPPTASIPLVPLSRPPTDLLRKSGIEQLRQKVSASINRNDPDAVREQNKAKLRLAQLEAKYPELRSVNPYGTPAVASRYTAADRAALNSKRLSVLANQIAGNAGSTREQILLNGSTNTIQKYIAAGGDPNEAANIRAQAIAAQYGKITGQKQNVFNSLTGGFSNKKFDSFLQSKNINANSDFARQLRGEYQQQGQTRAQGRAFGAAILAPIIAQSINELVGQGGDKRSGLIASTIGQGLSTGFTAGLLTGNPLIGAGAGLLSAGTTYFGQKDRVDADILAEQLAKVSDSFSRTTESATTYVTAQESIQQMLKEGVPDQKAYQQALEQSEASLQGINDLQLRRDLLNASDGESRGNILRNFRNTQGQDLASQGARVLFSREYKNLGSDNLNQIASALGREANKDTVFDSIDSAREYLTNLGLEVKKVNKLGPQGILNLATSIRDSANLYSKEKTQIDKTSKEYINVSQNRRRFDLASSSRFTRERQALQARDLRNNENVARSNLAFSVAREAGVDTSIEQLNNEIEQLNTQLENVRSDNTISLRENISKSIQGLGDENITQAARNIVSTSTDPADILTKLQGLFKDNEGNLTAIGDDLKILNDIEDGIRSSDNELKNAVDKIESQRIILQDQLKVQQTTLKSLGGSRGRGPFGGRNNEGRFDEPIANNRYKGYDLGPLISDASTQAERGAYYQYKVDEIYNKANDNVLNIEKTQEQFGADSIPIEQEAAAYSARARAKVIKDFSNGFEGLLGDVLTNAPDLSEQGQNIFKNLYGQAQEQAAKGDFAGAQQTLGKFNKTVKSQLGSKFYEDYIGENSNEIQALGLYNQDYYNRAGIKLNKVYGTDKLDINSPGLLESGILEGRTIGVGTTAEGNNNFNNAVNEFAAAVSLFIANPFGNLPQANNPVTSDELNELLNYNPQLSDIGKDRKSILDDLIKNNVVELNNLDNQINSLDPYRPETSFKRQDLQKEREQLATRQSSYAQETSLIKDFQDREEQRRNRYYQAKQTFIDTNSRINADGVVDKNEQQEFIKALRDLQTSIQDYIAIGKEAPANLQQQVETALEAKITADINVNSEGQKVELNETMIKEIGRMIADAIAKNNTSPQAPPPPQASGLRDRVRQPVY